ncbi:MAG: SHOCT domain-containing protein [Halobaculum sp.]
MAGPPRLRERNWHELIEHYTPDGALGRGLFGLLVGSGSGFLGIVALAVMFNEVGLLPILFGLVGGTVGLAGTLLALVVLWPVYLSLIGNVASADEYGVGAADDPADFEAGRDVNTDPGGTDPETILKRRYAAGELTREEFERRLDNVMDARPERRDRASTTTSGNERDRPDRERTRN